MIFKIKNNIFAIKFKEFGSKVYLIKLNNKNILIDTSSLRNQKQLIDFLNKFNLTPQNINILILTHNHWDHIENKNIFTNAKIYGDKKDFTQSNILNIDKLKIKEFKIIKTPGHSKGSFCILYQDVLFSGDTIFNNGIIGRTDLVGSNPQDMNKSLEKLKKVKFKILCPGH